MNKEKALKRIENAEKEIALAKAELNKLDELDMVPDNIQIERSCGGGDKLGIRFKDHVLYYYSETWAVGIRKSNEYNSHITPCHLVKIDRDNVLNGKHEGDTVFFTDYDDTTGKRHLNRYGKVVKDEVIHIDNSMMPHGWLINYWENYYKVTPVED